MKMYIIKEEKEYKILKVQPEQEVSFQKEFGKKVITEGGNLGELINNFQALNAEKMHINNKIGSFRTECEHSQKLSKPRIR